MFSIKNNTRLTQEQTDDATDAAEGELIIMVGGMPENVNLPRLAEWWRKWYLLVGHKRLGRIIMGVK